MKQGIHTVQNLHYNFKSSVATVYEIYYYIVKKDLHL